MQQPRSADQEAPHDHPSPRRLHSGFAWLFAGNAFYAATQWATLSLIAKLGSAEMLGVYALAVSIAAPVAMLSHLNLRSVLATDVRERYSLGDYLAVRYLVSLVGVIAVALIGAFNRDAWLATTLIGLSMAIENVSDVYYGALQRRDRVEHLAGSMIARGAVSVAALAAGLWMTRDLVVGIAGMIAARLVLLLGYDRRKGSEGERLLRSGWSSQWEILRSALPLGGILMLVSLNSNVPRYAVEHYFGARELGIFAAAASFITVGATATNALGQTAISRLARYFSAGDVKRFRALAIRMSAVPVVLGAAGVLVAALFGSFVLRVVYRPEFAPYSGLLVAMMGAGILIYLGSTLGYVVTSVRVFTAQLPLFAASVAVCAVASWTLLPVMGLYGAALALGISALTQVAGNMMILRRALRRVEMRAT